MFYTILTLKMFSNPDLQFSLTERNQFFGGQRFPVQGYELLR